MMPKLNIELAKRLVTRLRRMRHEAHFNMSFVANKTECGTAMCIAGHTLDLSGYKRRPHCEYCSLYDWLTPDGAAVQEPLGEAKRLLGLRQTRLFHRYDLKTPKQAADVVQGMIDKARGNDKEPSAAR